MTLIDTVAMIAQREKIKEQLNIARREEKRREIKRLQILIEPFLPLPAEPSLPEHLTP